MRKYWKGHGQAWNGRYWLSWDRQQHRESMLYIIFSSVTGKIILRIEVF